MRGTAGYKQKIRGESIGRLSLQAIVYGCLGSGASSYISLSRVYDN